MSHTRYARLRTLTRAVVGLAAAWASAGIARAGQDAAATQSTASAPVSFTRDDSGRATVRAIRLTEPLRVDGELNESVYRSTAPVTDFFQTLPQRKRAGH